MRGKKVQYRFDAGAWIGQVDMTRAVVTVSALAGLGILWLIFAKLILF